jgi:glutaminase
MKPIPPVLLPAMLCIAGLGIRATPPPGPSLDRAVIVQAVREAHAKFKDEAGGRNAQCFSQVPSTLFGIAVVTTSGEIVAVGDAGYAFALESVAKPFTAALVMQRRGAETIVEKIGVEPTGMPFNSVTAVEMLRSRSANPLVNAGALATVSLVPGATASDRWQSILGWFAELAGEKLAVNEEVYRAESGSNEHNRGIAELLRSYGRIYADPLETCDIYTRQCAIAVTARQLAVMGATLANGGVNPVTKSRVIDSRHVPRLLAVMMMAGLYNEAGEWAWNAGLPAKAGTSGGILAIAPGRAALVGFSPPLDRAGTSVRAAKALQFLAERLGLNLFGPVDAAHARVAIDRAVFPPTTSP